MKRLIRLLPCLLLAGAVATPAAAFDFATLYLKRVQPAVPLPGGGVSELLLQPCAPLRDSEQQDQRRALPNGAEAVWPPFFTVPQDEPQVLPAGESTVRVFITTGRLGQMLDCAEVTAELHRETPAGRFLLAQGTVAATLLPRLEGGIAEPVAIPVPVGGAESARTFGPGEVLSLTLRVRNVCEDGQGRNLTLRFDSAALASRIELANVDIPDDGGAADPDGDGIPNLCDNCDDVANVAQTDTNDDGLGDACTPCEPGGPTPPECVCIGTCDDQDDCTLDSCDAALGCFNEPIPFLDGVRCRLTEAKERIDEALAPQIDPKLQRKRSPLQRKLKRAVKMLNKSSKAVVKGKPDAVVGRKLRKLRRAITAFIGRVEKAREENQMTRPLRDAIIYEADGALAQSTEEAAP